ncbi:unnamed protein product [Pleuronectes platessa]|uniref:Uncharacterized protein n=1 Tax=Pleuronectes platessa TaxID=8262 RepID=A0A9N7V506_PLEPL|nr:unnamed protein product [Pleuronectes platessa]
MSLEPRGPGPDDYSKGCGVSGVRESLEDHMSRCGNAVNGTAALLSLRLPSPFPPPLSRGEDEAVTAQLGSMQLLL